MDLDLFHKFSQRHGQWSAEHPEDKLIANLARTWRLSETPHYIVAFHIPNHGLDRLTEWERSFTSGEADQLIVTSRLANRIDVSGCYDVLIAPQVAGPGRYYVEFFDAEDGADYEKIADFFNSRGENKPQHRLHLLAMRIGHLGPDPRGVAVWRIPDYGHLEGIARELIGVRAPVWLVRAGLYADVGSEIL